MAKETIGDDGIVARWGGDEFVGIIYGPHEGAAVQLNKLVENINQIREGELEQMTISLGATKLTDSNNLVQFIHEADIAMYRAKNEGRNRMTFFKEN